MIGGVFSVALAERERQRGNRRRPAWSEAFRLPGGHRPRQAEPQAHRERVIRQRNPEAGLRRHRLSSPSGSALFRGRPRGTLRGLVRLVGRPERDAFSHLGRASGSQRVRDEGGLARAPSRVVYCRAQGCPSRRSAQKDPLGAQAHRHTARERPSLGKSASPEPPCSHPPGRRPRRRSLRKPHTGSIPPRTSSPCERGCGRSVSRVRRRVRGRRCRRPDHGHTRPRRSHRCRGRGAVGSRDGNPGATNAAPPAAPPTGLGRSTGSRSSHTESPPPRQCVIRAERRHPRM